MTIMAKAIEIIINVPSPERDKADYQHEEAWMADAIRKVAKVSTHPARDLEFAVQYSNPLTLLTKFLTWHVLGIDFTADPKNAELVDAVQAALKIGLASVASTLEAHRASLFEQQEAARLQRERSRRPDPIPRQHYGVVLGAEPFGRDELLAEEQEIWGEDGVVRPRRKRRCGSGYTFMKKATHIPSPEELELLCDDQP